MADDEFIDALLRAYASSEGVTTDDGYRKWRRLMEMVDQPEDYARACRAVASVALERAAEVAKAHRGSAGRVRITKGFAFKRLSPEAQDEVAAEERGEDIAAEIIERSIRALIPQEKDPT